MYLIITTIGLLLSIFVVENDMPYDITAEEFRKPLERKRPSRIRLESSCAYDDGDDGPPHPPEVHPQDLVLLESIGPVPGRGRKKKTAIPRRRTSSETSFDENKIQATIEKAERELAVVSAGMSMVQTPQEAMDRPSLPMITLRTSSQSYDNDDDVIIDEMFECESQELDDTVRTSIYPPDISPAHRSNSVGGNSELRKRNRNWSGTATSLSAVSPSGSRHMKGLALSPVPSKSVVSSDEESSQPSGNNS